MFSHCPPAEAESEGGSKWWEGSFPSGMAKVSQGRDSLILSWQQDKDE